MKTTTILSIILMCLSIYGCTSDTKNATTDEVQHMDFERKIIDEDLGGRTAIGDIDGDGINDVVLHTWGSERGVVADGSVTWYKSPDMTKTIIAENEKIFGDGVVVHDVDGDQINDVVICKGNDQTAEIYWCRNNGKPTEPLWEQYFVARIDDESEVKDVEVHDMDNDGKADIVVRTKHRFCVFFQNSPDEWYLKQQTSREREGMSIGDLDRDGDYDVVMNGFFYENPEDPRHDDWPLHLIDDLWFTDSTGGWQDFSVMTAVDDFDGDGHKDDVVFGHPEKTGFHVAWYHPDDLKGGKAGWTRHEIGVVDYCHTVYAEDMDMDGDVDVLTGVLKRSEAPTITIFLNDGTGMQWSRYVVDSTSTYKAKVGDIDGDGDPDITGALSWEDPPLSVWVNTIKEK